MIKKERVEKWDILRFVLIFLVVLGHICDGYIGDTPKVRALFFCIYLFHMPLFIFVSGLFSKRNIEEKRYHKILSYLLLFILTEIVICIFKIIIFKSPSFSLLSESGLAWYGFAIFVQELITIVFRKFSKKYVFVLSILLACFVGFDESVADWLTLSRIIVFYPFFFAGYCLSRERIEKLCKDCRLKIGAAVFLIAVFAGIFWKIDMIYGARPLITGRNPYQALGDYYIYGPVLRLLYYAGVFLVCFAVMAIIPDRLGKGKIAKWGSRSLQVYVIHYGFLFVLYGKLHIDQWLMNLPVIGRLYIFPLAFLIVVICSAGVLERPFRMLINPPYKEE